MIFKLNDTLQFPDPAFAEEDGLLAFGGDLSPERLLLAYRNGIFPWPAEGEPLLWYSPPERFVLFPEKLNVSKSLQKVIDRNEFQITVNRAFPEVIHACASVRRKDQPGTWISEDMEKAYMRLHELGHAHSIEAWKDDKLTGGLYGVQIGSLFCGESMFAYQSNASKAAFVTFVRSRPFLLVDCQVYTNHLKSLGAELISRSAYQHLLAQAQT
jgi:leucyl/phenylalanyl-tRNA--protein transferase